MKLLITGSKGQLGKELTKACLDRGIKYAAGDIDEIDITDLKRVKDCVRQENPTVIINCAAYNAVDRAEEDFEQACLVNGIGPKNLAIAAEENRIPLMHFSTDFVFDGAKGSPYTICDLPNPINRYGESKLLGERMVEALTSRFYLIRLSWVFGSGGINFPRKVLEWAKDKSSVQMVSDQISCPSYTADLVEPIFKLLENGAYGLYHLANNGHCSRYEWATFVLERAMPNVEVVPVKSDAFPTLAKRPAFSAMETFPMKSILGDCLPDWQDATKRFLLEIGVC